MMIFYRFRSYIFSSISASIHDFIIILLAWLFAFWLSFDLQTIPPQIFEQALASLIWIVPIQFTVFHIFGLYKGIWRFASLPDIVRIVKAVFIGVSLSIAFLFIINRAEGLPRSVPIIYSVILLFMVSGPRLLYRWIKDRYIRFPRGNRVMIVGSGNAGEMLARDIQRNKTEDYQPIIFVDDNPRRLGRDILGLPIAGRTTDIPSLVIKYQIDLIMLAIPSAGSADIRRIVEICETTRVPFRYIPQLKDLISGHVSVNELRDVSIEDLLGRAPVNLDWDAISKTLANKKMLITGAGGSIGSELCRQVCRFAPTELILIDNSEYNLYQVEMEIREKFPDLLLRQYLGDVTDKLYVESIFNRHHPQIVFHAAAYKHVPMLETQIRQAMNNNVLGTKITADAADRFGADIFILVSTDKAVNPANIMGASKRIAEIYCQNLNSQSNTRYITIRFGNVLGSAGSVIPLFTRQIQQGGPVTVTDPRMERYFMTIPEACQLIMQTTTLGNGGEIFVLDMGQPVKISYLAEQMIRLSGKIPGQDIDIEYIGLRPGEKLYEELFHEKEQLEGTTHKKVLLAMHRKVDWKNLQDLMNEIEESCKQLDDEKLLPLVNTLVPEYFRQIRIDDNAVNNTSNNTSNNGANVVHLSSSN